MIEVSLENDKTPITLPYGACVYVSCSSAVTIHRKVEGLLFQMEAFARGNHSVCLVAGEYVIRAAINTCKDCVAYIDHGVEPPHSVVRDLELVCVKDNNNPLVAPIKAWAMGEYDEDTDTVGTRVYDINGTPIDLSQHTVVECCC